MELKELKKLALKHNTEIVRKYSDNCDFCMYDDGCNNFEESAVITTYNKAETDKWLEGGGYDEDIVHFYEDELGFKLTSAILDEDVKIIWLECEYDFLTNSEDEIRDQLNE